MLTVSEVKAIIGQPVTEAKASSRRSGAFDVSQCFYVAEPFAKSVSVEITRYAPVAVPSGERLREFWKKRFVEAQATKKSDRPRAVSGVGEGAFWVGSSKVGALYALKKGTLVRVSVGGAGEEADKLAKSKRLAQRALNRL